MATKDATFTMRVDQKLKDDANRDLEALGLDMSTLFTMTLKAVTREHAIPFDLQLKPTPELATAIADVDAGRTTGAIPFDEYLAEVDSYDAD